MMNSPQNNSLSDPDWEVLLDSIVHKDCTPFLGAGASFSYIPLGTELATQLADEVKFPFHNKTNLIEVSQYGAVVYTPAFVKRKVAGIFNASVKKPSFGENEEIYSLLADLELPLYMTTNYDHLMVNALEHVKRPYKQLLCNWNQTLQEKYGHDDTIQLSAQMPIVYHMHGHLDEVESFVLTEDDYLDFIANINRLQIIPSEIEGALGTTSLLFIGYSLNDWNFRVLFRSISRFLEISTKKKHVSVQLLPREGDDTPQQRERIKEYLNAKFHKLDVTVYWGTCQQFASELRQRWNSHNGKI